MDPVRVSIIKSAGAELAEYDADVCCLSTVAQAKAPEAWIRERVGRGDGSLSGMEIVATAAKRFPKLVLCDDAIAFLEAQSGREKHFPQILRHLSALNQSLEQWKVGSFDVVGISWSFESESTIKNSKLRRLREFVGPDGVRYLMSAHTKLIGANIRIHFLPAEATRSALVGYIGPHLQTSSY